MWRSTGSARLAPLAGSARLALVALGGAAVWALEVWAGVALMAWAGPAGGAALAAAVNLAVAARFALTLRAGRVPLISRYAMADHAGLPEALRPYTRGLTALWAALLAGAAGLHLLPAFGIGSTATLLTWQAAALALFFVGEHAERTRRFPQIGRSTPWRTLRAIIAASRRAPARG